MRREPRRRGPPCVGRRAMRVGGWLGAIVLLAGSGFALEAEDFGERWRWYTFDRESQLPAGAPSALGHDQDDMVYVATPRGLYRYDGYRWTRITPAHQEEPWPIIDIVESNRRVFVVTPRDVWVVRGDLEMHRVLEDGPFLVSASPQGGIFGIDVTAREHFQIEKENELRVLDAVPRTTSDRDALVSGVPEIEIHDYVIDHRRIHWLATSGGLLRRDIQRRSPWKLDFGLEARLRRSSCRRLFLVRFQRILRDQYTFKVGASDPEYELWALVDGLEGRPVLLRHHDRGKYGEWVEVNIRPAGLAVSDLLRDGAGNYYATSGDGEFFFSRDGDEWFEVERLGINQARLYSGFVDAYGLVWYAYDISMGIGGVAWFDPLSRRWQRVASSPEGARLEVLSLLQSSDGSTWVGTVSGLRHYHEGKLTIHRKIGDAQLRRITGLAEDSRGNVWISSDRFEDDGFDGVFYFTGEVWIPERPEDLGELNSSPVFRIVPGRRGDLWFLSKERLGDGQGSRLYRLVPSRFGTDRLETLDIQAGRVNDFLEAQDGSYWAATENGLVRILTPTERQRFDDDDGLASPRTWALAENPADGSIWVCYAESGSGVTRILGDSIEHFDQDSGLESPKVWSIAATNSSSRGFRIWVGTDRGLSCFDGECWYNYRVGSLDPQSSPTLWSLSTSPYTSATGEEVLLVGTLGNGAFRFRFENPRRPRFMDALSAQSDGRSGAITISWDARDFKDQTPPDDLRFRYQVDDRPWSRFSGNRQVTFRGLEPGVPHRIAVEVRDRDGNPNRTPLRQTFHVQAPRALPLWLSRVLIAASVLAALLLAVGLFRGARRLMQPVLRLRHAFDGGLEPVLVIDRRGRIVDFNASRPELLGLQEVPRRRLVGLPAHMVPALQEGEALDLLQRALAGAGGTCSLVTGAGETQHFLTLKAVPVHRNRARLNSANGAILYFEDRTEPARELADQRRRGRFGAVRDLSLRIREELDQVLSDLNRDLDALRASDPAGGDGELGNLERQSQRMKELIEALGDFSRDTATLERVEMPIQQLIDDALGVTRDGRPGLPAGVDIDFRAQPGLWTVEVEPRPMRRGFEEIVRNAVDAMPDGGRITIRLANLRLDRADGDLRSGRYVEATVTDSGPGMDPRQIERVFDPFYTTKSRFSHRGLGLSVAYGVVRRHGGDIRIHSLQDSGTSVRVILPAAGAFRGSKPAASRAGRAAPK